MMSESYERYMNGAWLSRNWDFVSRAMTLRERGKRYNNARAAVWEIAENERTISRVYDCRRNRQTESGVSAIQRGISRPIERLKDSLLLRARDAESAVAHREHDGTVLPFSAELDARTLR